LVGEHQTDLRGIETRTTLSAVWLQSSDGVACLLCGEDSNTVKPVSLGTKKRWSFKTRWSLRKGPIHTKLTASKQ